MNFAVHASHFKDICVTLLFAFVRTGILGCYDFENVLIGENADMEFEIGSD